MNEALDFTQERVEPNKVFSEKWLAKTEDGKTFAKIFGHKDGSYRVEVFGNSYDYKDIAEAVKHTKQFYADRIKLHPESATEDIWNSGNYFKLHPDHILGVEAKGTTRWGEEITIVKKDKSIGEISKLIIGDGITPKPEPWHLDMAAPKAEGKKFAATDREKRIAEAIEKTKHQKENPPVAGGIQMTGFADIQTKYGGNITEDEIRVWVWYQRGRMFSDSAILNKQNGYYNYITPLTEVEEKKQQWLKAGLLCYDGNEYLPAVLFFAGNINGRILTVRNNEGKIMDAIGKEAFQKQIDGLQAAMPAPLKLMAPESERLFLSPIDPFCQKHTISTLADGTVFEEETTLVFAFEQWMESLSEQDFKNGSNSYEVRFYYMQRGRFPNDTPQSEKIAVKRRAQQDGLALFSRFLYEAVTREDQQIIEHIWNTTYNGYKEFDYNKIPIGFEINKYFKGGALAPTPAQWDGVRFLTVNGSGTCAYDVGVGKTMTAILAMAQALYTGQCKRPLVIVPNPTYKKWIAETVGEFNADGTVKVNGVLPQYRDRINDYYNLGVEIEDKLPERWAKDYTITFITYEGLLKLGLSKAVRDSLGEELFTILQQGNLEARDIEKLREEIDSIVGNLNSEVIANFDDLGFDYIVCDEAHNFKKIFTRVQGRKGEGDGDKKATSPYQIDSGPPSNRGLKLFALTQYVLRQNSMRNVILLTATPFTNSPLEIYSMLALTSYQLLEQRGITNLIDFFDKFINEESELSITIKGKFESKPVIKTFNNRIVLQSIIFNSIIYKTGEEAGVPRPIKIVYPWVKDEKGILLPPDKRIDSSLRPTPDQERWLKEVARFANAEKGNAIEPFVPASYYEDGKKDKGKLMGRVLIAINLAKMCTLSPYLMKVGGEEEGVNVYEKENPDYKEFIKSSPKLTYVMDCIKTVREWHVARNEPVSGQIIYMNMATSYFPFIKEFLVQQIGYDAKEVEIIIGGMSQEKKERIKDKFLSGDVKIIIGSASIKEGIDLQTRTTVLYNCNMDWNPTDIKQLEGRAWRQGNIHSYVRIVTPLIENSLDVFLFQKLEEKTSRINDIWYRKGRGNVLKLEDFDPAELKMGLMTDPEERVKAEIELEVTKLQNRKAVSDGVAKRVGEAQEAIKEITDAGREIDNDYQDGKKELAIVLREYRDVLADKNISNTKRTEFESKERTLAELLGREVTDKTKIAVAKRYAKNIIATAGQWQHYKAYRIINNCDDQTKRFNELENVQKNILEPKGLTMADDLEPVITEAQKESLETDKEIKHLKSEEYIKQRVEQVKDEMAAKKALSKSIEERVKEFTRQNYLLSCLKGVHICSLDNALIGEAKNEDKERTKEMKVVTGEPQPDAEKQKRLRLAKAKAAALKLKLQLQEPLKEAA